VKISHAIVPQPTFPSPTLQVQARGGQQAYGRWAGIASSLHGKPTSTIESLKLAKNLSIGPGLFPITIAAARGVNVH
jgi:hypothetical protein